LFIRVFKRKALHKRSSHKQRGFWFEADAKQMPYCTVYLRSKYFWGNLFNGEKEGEVAAIRSTTFSYPAAFS
jgi:hypothetical protein